jgi:hypothetical protein
MLRSVCWLRTDLSGLPIDPTFKGQVSTKKAVGLKGGIIQKKVWAQIGLQRPRSEPIGLVGCGGLSTGDTVPVPLFDIIS